MDNNNNGNNYNPQAPQNGSYNNPNTTQPNNYNQPNNYDQLNEYKQPNNYNQPNGYNQLNNYNQPNGYNQLNNYNQPNGYNQQNYNYNQPNNFNQPNGYPNAPFDPGKNMATASLVLGILGCVMPYGIGLVLAILSIVFSVVSANKSQEAGLPRNGMATAGLICGIVSCGIALITIIACFSFSGCVACYNTASYPYY